MCASWSVRRRKKQSESSVPRSQNALRSTRARHFLAERLLAALLSFVPLMALHPDTARGVFVLFSVISLMFGLLATITPESKFEKFAISLMSIFNP